LRVDSDPLKLPDVEFGGISDIYIQSTNCRNHCLDSVSNSIISVKIIITNKFLVQFLAAGKFYDTLIFSTNTNGCYLIKYYENKTHPFSVKIQDKLQR
jgi:hypothetical protein